MSEPLADGATSSPPPSFDALVAAVGECTGARDADADQWGVVRATTRPIRHLALCLDHADSTPDWLARCAADALFVHRPWRVDVARLPRDLGIVFSHAPYDERLTTGYNAALAEALGMDALGALGERDGRPIGMLGDVEPATAADAVDRVSREFGGHEAEQAGDGRMVTRVAVMSAMTDALVREAASRGAGLYVTGQLRRPGVAAAIETGVHVLALGHRRSERWGLAALARMLAARFPGLRTTVSVE